MLDNGIPNGDRALAKTLLVAVKHLVGTIISLGVISGFFSTIIVYSGGKFPPWVTKSEVQEIVDTAVNKVYDRWNADKCADYNARFLRAIQILRMMPNDTAALLQYTDFSNTIDQIPNCKKATLP